MTMPRGKSLTPKICETQQEQKKERKIRHKSGPKATAKDGGISLKNQCVIRGTCVPVSVPAGQVHLQVQLQVHLEVQVRWRR